MGDRVPHQRVGPKVVIAVLERDPRCVVITLDPDTGEATPQVLRQVDPVIVPAFLVVAPEGAGDVAAHDHFDRERLEPAHDENAGIGHVEDVVRRHVLRLLEPEYGETVEQLALERDGGEDAVERREAIGGDHHDAVVSRVVVADFAPVELAQGGEVGFFERERKLSVESVHGGAQDSACGNPIRAQPSAQLAEHRRGGAGAGEHRRGGAVGRRAARIRSRAGGQAGSRRGRRARVDACGA